MTLHTGANLEALLYCLPQSFSPIVFLRSCDHLSWLVSLVCTFMLTSFSFCLEFHPQRFNGTCWSSQLFLTNTFCSVLSCLNTHLDYSIPCITWECRESSFQHLDLCNQHRSTLHLVLNASTWPIGVSIPLFCPFKSNFTSSYLILSGTTGTEDTSHFRFLTALARHASYKNTPTSSAQLLLSSGISFTEALLHSIAVGSLWSCLLTFTDSSSDLGNCDIIYKFMSPTQPGEKWVSASSNLVFHFNRMPPMYLLSSFVIKAGSLLHGSHLSRTPTSFHQRLSYLLKWHSTETKICLIL